MGFSCPDLKHNKQLVTLEHLVTLSSGHQVLPSHGSQLNRPEGWEPTHTPHHTPHCTHLHTLLHTAHTTMGRDWTNY